MNLPLNVLTVKELEMPAVVATKKNAGAQDAFLRFFFIGIGGRGSSKFCRKFRKGFDKRVSETAVSKVRGGYGSVFGFHIPVRGIANGTPHAVRTVV